MPISFGRRTTLSSGTRFYTRDPIRLVNRNHRRSLNMRGVTTIKTLGDTTKAGRSTEPLPAKHRRRAATKKQTPANAKQEEADRSVGHLLPWSLVL